MLHRYTLKPQGTPEHPHKLPEQIVKEQRRISSSETDHSTDPIVGVKRLFF
jgi:hypothetical protein